MLTKSQFKIFEVFTKRPFEEHTRNQIKKESKEKSNNFLSLAINLLKKEKVLEERIIGKSGILTLNLESDLTFDYLSLSSKRNISPLVESSLDILKKEILEKTPFFSLVIFGSYAVGKEKKGSDLDIAIFIEDTTDKKHIEAIGNSVKLKTLLDLDLHVIPKQEMLQMLKDKHENLGKQIARKHLAVYNARIYYEIIKEGMKNGFRL